MSYQSVGLDEVEAIAPAGQRNLDVQETRMNRARGHDDMAALAWTRDAGPEAAVKAQRKSLQSGALNAFAAHSGERVQEDTLAGRDIVMGAEDATQAQNPAASQADGLASSLDRAI